jgi:hypothetical protein
MSEMQRVGEAGEHTLNTVSMKYDGKGELRGHGEAFDQVKQGGEGRETL